MRRILSSCCLALALTLALALALASGVVIASGGQSAAPRTWEQMQASFNAHKAEFDYLLGDWTFTGNRREPGGDIKIRGYWSALRLAEGQILDEYRAVDDKGETIYVTTTLRAYNGQRDQWDLISADTGAGLRDLGTAHWTGTEMRLEQTFGVGTKYPTRWRIRYHDIKPDRFSWRSDRSLDDGKTWVTDFMTLEARRVGPPRSMGPLTDPARASAASTGAK
jgi:hypothetical protein